MSVFNSREERRITRTITRTGFTLSSMKVDTSSLGGGLSAPNSLTNVQGSSDGTTLTVTGTTGQSAVIFGIEFSVNTIPGTYPFSFNTPGGATSQSIGLILANWGINGGDTVYIMAYTNSDSLDGIGTRVYGTPTLTVVLPVTAITITPAQAWTRGTATASVSATRAISTPTIGDLLVACVNATGLSGFPTNVAVTDDGTGSWTKIAGEYWGNEGPQWMSIWIKKSAGNETVITATPSAPTTIELMVGTYLPSSVPTSYALDGLEATNTQTGTTTPNPGNNTASTQCVLNIGLIVTDVGSPTAAGTPAHTRVQNFSFIFFTAVEEALNPGAGTLSAAWTSASCTPNTVGVNVKAVP